MRFIRLCFQARRFPDGDLHVQRMNVNLRKPMSEHEREALTALCARIVAEKDRAVFLELLIELESLLDIAGWPKSDA